MKGLKNFWNFWTFGENTPLIQGIGSETYKILRNLAAPKQTKFDDNVKSFMLKSFFKPTLNIISERYKFNMKSQEPSESISDFILELKVKSQTCEFKEFLGEALCIERSIRSWHQ